jgi:outer membrane protein, multidrug efflux system
MSSNRAWVIVASAAVVLTACKAVGPDYVRPVAALANNPAFNSAFQGGKETRFLAAPLPSNWWKLYRDPALDALVEQAIAANTDLRVAAANIAKAQATSDFAVAARSPSTTVTAAPGFGRRSAEEELIPGGPLPASFTYGLGIGASYQVDLFGQISRAVEAAQADVYGAQAAYDAARVTVVAEVTRAYLESCSAGREHEVAQRVVDLQTQSRALTVRLVAAGRAISLDELRSAALEDQVRATLPQLQARKQVALYQLAALTGHPMSETSGAAKDCGQEPVIDQAIPIGDGAGLLKRRPDVRKAESELHAATARIGVVTSDLYPKISFGASIGSVGLDRKFLDDSTIKFSIGPLVSWQFPDRSRTRARIRGAEADEQIAFANFDGVVLRALRETESALTIYARDLDARALLASSRDRSRLAADKTERLFKSGRLAFLPVLDANRVRIASEQSLAAADSKLAVDQVNLFLALGGGWGEGESNVSH